VDADVVLGAGGKSAGRPERRSPGNAGAGEAPSGNHKLPAVSALLSLDPGLVLRPRDAG
jgi:hypothetical protein